MAEDKIRVGIDLGTTNTLACYMKDSKPTILKFPGGGGELLPSVLYLEEDGTVLVGMMAKRKGVSDPVNMIRSSKTEMGNFEKTWTLRGRKFTPTDVAAEILKEVKRNVLKKLKAEPDTEVEAVITVPAYFTSNQIDETKKAGTRAGLNVLGIVTEPRAAAIANIKEFGMDNQKVFVVDLGGGTFDVSILEADHRQYETLAVDGDRKLGGDDFDKRIYDYIIRYVEEEQGLDLSSQEKSGLTYKEYYEMVGSVTEAATEAKEELSRSEEYEVVIPNLFTYKDDKYSLELPITRQEFYELCDDLFEKIRSRIYRVFESTGNRNVKIEDIDSLILAGGSCYIPKIKADVENIFHKSADTTMNRSTMVVTGACFIADSWDDLSDGNRDIISHSLGVEVQREEDGKMILSKILNRGCSYPCSEKKSFTTTRDNQESVPIVIYEAGSDKENVDEIEMKDEQGNLIPVHDLYGSFELTNIEKAAKGVPKIEVTFDYDRSRLLTVTARDLKTGAEKKVTVTKGVRAQRPPQIEPVDFELLIDVSGSMSYNRKLQQAQEAAIRLVSEIIDLSVHRVGIISFGERVEEMSPLSQNKGNLILSIDRLSARGGTFMDRAIRLGAQILQPNGKRRVLLIVTDGAPNSESATTAAAKEAVAQGIDIITIAVGAGESATNYLNTLASNPQYAFSIDSMGQLADMFVKVVNQYLSEIHK